MADGTVLETLGIPAAAIITDAFVSSGNAMAKAQGFPGYRYSMIPHPLSSLTLEEVQQRALSVLPDVLDILGVIGDSHQ